MMPDTKPRAKGDGKPRPKKRAANTEPETAKASAPAATKAASPQAVAEDERRLARGAAIGIPIATVLASLVVAAFTSAGPALLVLAGGIILGTIALFWASLRTLTGDAPLAADLEDLYFSAPADPLAARKTMLLRALKDLDGEKAVGKIHAADYAVLSQRYREEIKDIMRTMDASIAPHVKDAEAALQKHLVRVGLAGDPFRTAGKVGQAKDEALAADDEAEAAAATPARPSCPVCATSNDVDARFCKSCGGTLPATVVISKDLEAVLDVAARLAKEHLAEEKRAAAGEAKTAAAAEPADDPKPVSAPASGADEDDEDDEDDERDEKARVDHA